MRWLVIVGGAIVTLLVVFVVMVRRDDPKPEPRPASNPASMSVAHDERSTVIVDAQAPRAASIDASTDHTSDRETLLAGLRDSGSGVESWDAQGATLLTSLATGGVTLRDATCYVAGCSATFTFPTERDYQRHIAELETSELYRAWTGGKRLSTPETRPDGRVIVALLLYRPD